MWGAGSRLPKITVSAPQKATYIVIDNAGRPHRQSYRQIPLPLTDQAKRLPQITAQGWERRLDLNGRSRSQPNLWT
jgi:hypothetical protein